MQKANTKTWVCTNKKWRMKYKQACKSDLDIVSFNEQGSHLSVVEEGGDMDNILITDSNKQ